MNYAFFDSKGKILFVLNSPNQRFAKIQGGEFVPVSSEVLPDTHYLDLVNKKAVIKKDFDTRHHAEGGLAVKFIDLPEGVAVETLGKTVITDSEPLVVNYDSPGTYKLKLSGLIEYNEAEVEVTIGDP